MARQIVTSERVAEIANALVLEGQEPSIVAVQAQIGGGSYSTVKRYLDVWRQERAEAAASAPDMPSEIAAKGAEFARTVWAMASRQAQRDAQGVKDAAAKAEAALRGELVGAQAEIARLEQTDAHQAETIEQQAAKLREIELALAEVQAQARRVPELESTLADTRAQLDAARRDVSEARERAAGLAGQMEALASQNAALLAALPQQNNAQSPTGER